MIDMTKSGDGFNTVNISDLSLEPLPRQVDARGYMYIVVDKMFPDWVKIGRTNDPKKRLQAYNSDKPFNTCSYIHMSESFVDVIEVERMILELAYENAAPSTTSKEWFVVGEIDNLVSYIGKAEARFALMKDQ